MSEEDSPKAKWIKFVATSAIAIVTLIAGFIQFGTTSAFSVRQPFLEMQTKLCQSAAEHAARLASSIDPETWSESREEFWMLYWGPLAIVEDVEANSRVATEMKIFGDDLKSIGTTQPTLPVSSLEQPALRVAHACRDLLSTKWTVGILKWFRH